MKILEYPNDSLRVKAVAVEKVTPELQKVAQEMYKTMIDGAGVGLAATQVGLDIRLFVLDNAGSPIICFNPHIMKKSTDVQYETEGCLSFPGAWRKIKRAKEVHVKYRDLNGKMTYNVLAGLMSIAFQHELDHLNSILYIDYEEKKDD